jgi:hypothetical protein
MKGRPSFRKCRLGEHRPFLAFAAVALSQGANIALETDASSLIVEAFRAMLPISARISSGSEDCAARAIAAPKLAMVSG